MEKLDLCRLCLANSTNTNMLPTTKTMERTMSQFNMLYSVSGVNTALGDRVMALLYFAESRFQCRRSEARLRTVLDPNR